MSLEAGTLNRRILVERKQSVEDPLGGTIDTWVPFAGDGKLWADIRILNGLETVKNSAIVSVTKGSIRIRFRKDIDATCRVTHDGTVFEITSVQPDLSGREFLDLAVQTGANNG